MHRARGIVIALFNQIGGVDWMSKASLGSGFMLLALVSFRWNSMLNFRFRK